MKAGHVDTPGRGLKRLVSLLALLALSTALSVGAAELVVRGIRPQPLERITPGLYQADPELRFRLRPGHQGEISNQVDFTTWVRINDQGLRNGELPPERDGRPRLLMLGDSYVFGWGVERAELLTTHLAAAERGWDVVNAGVPGYGVPDSVAWLERYGLDLEPDLVVLGVFVGNDLLDATERYGTVQIAEGLVSATSAAEGMRARLVHLSHLVRLAKRAIPISWQRGLRSAMGMSEPWAIGYRRATLESFARTPTPLVQEGRRNTEVAFSRLAQLSNRHRFEVRVLLLPDPIQVYPERWSATLRALVEDASAYQPEVPSQYFGELGTRHGFATLDLLPAFTADRAVDEELYFRYDPHWTGEGHALAAAGILEFLRESRALDAALLTGDRRNIGSGVVRTAD